MNFETFDKKFFESRESGMSSFRYRYEDGDGFFYWGCNPVVH